MKFFNVKFLTAFLFLGVMVFTACDETTTNPTDNNPVITSVTPGSGAIGDVVTINGTIFGLATDPGSVYFIQGSTKIQAQGTVGGSGSDYLSWTDTQIKVKVPVGTPEGAVKIQVYNGATELLSNQVDFVVGTPPSAPSNAMATSKNNTSVIVKWTPSTDSKVVRHKVYIYQGSGAKGAYPTTTKTEDRMTITGLTEGVVYTFIVKAVTASGMESIEDVSVDWSPASRFYENTSTKIYEFDSDLGSGLDLYDAAAGGPVNRKATEKSKWNIGIDTRNGKLLFQSGSEITVGSTNAQETHISLDYFDNALSLDNVFDSKAFTTGNFAARSIELLESEFNGEGVVFIVRTSEPGQTEYNYAKVLIKKDGGKFLQGTSPNRYIDCIISYQKVAGVPYAR
jgi:hypothetical protein